MRKFEGFQKGINLGGWISQYDRYDPVHFESFITEKDIEYIASLGFDHVRVPVDFHVLEDDSGKYLESGFGYLENCLNWCRKNGLHMVIDLHECYGYSFDPLKCTTDNTLFQDEKKQQRFLKLWTKIAQRFGAYPDLVAFEPLNEVILEEEAKPWNELIRKYIETVRVYAPETYIIIGGVWRNHVLTVKLLDPPYDSKIVYNFHCYEPLVFTHQGAYWIDVMPRDFRTEYPKTMEEYRAESEYALRDRSIGAMGYVDSEQGPAFFEKLFSPAMEVAEKYDVPLYCGEYGVIDLADNKSKLRWLNDIHVVFKAHGIGHALWNYKNKDFGLVDEHFSEIRDEFIAIV